MVKNKEESFGQKIPFPFLVLNNHSKGRLEDSFVGNKITYKWVRNEKDTGNFDLDFLLEYNKALEKMRQ